MLRALWFAVKTGLIVAAAVWVANRPGFIEASWLGYDVRAHVGLVLLVLLFLLVVVEISMSGEDLGAEHQSERRQ